MHADGKSTLALVSKWNSGKINCCLKKWAEEQLDETIGSCEPTFIGCTLKEDQPLRLLLNLFFYLFKSFKPTYKSQCIKLLDVIATCNQCSKSDIEHVERSFGAISQIISY